MTDANRGQKKRLTIAATPEGIEKAKKALIRLGFGSKSSFAESQPLAKSSVDKFFTGQPIQLKTFQKICQELTLDWMVIADIAEPESSSPRELHQGASLAVGGEVATSRRQVTVVDAQTKQVKAVVVLEGDLDSLPNLKILTAILREYSGDSINIVDIQQGSIRLIIKGSPEDIEKLLSRFEAGEITELNGFPVEDLQILDNSSDSSDADAQRLNNKWDLVREIVSHPREGRQLSEIDFSDADLSRAILSGAILSGADLSGADLSGANLSRAILNGANLSRAILNGAYLSRAILSGAILSGAILSGAKLFRADLSGADLSGANLSRAYLSLADLSGADLSGADLSGADLSGADLSGADLSGANVAYTRFTHSEGISDSLKRNLIERGAIFEDSPNDRSRVLV